jgi:2-dehydro-3-deoxyphosphogluconate aldolase/(4S)-4-hydroxy-2-oxoglutarate aldolase
MGARPDEATPVVIERRSPIAIIRLDDLSRAIQIAGALVRGGVTALEFTLTNGEAPEAIRKVKAELGSEAMVGAGTVLEPEEARQCIEAGADFLVTPILSVEVIEAGVQARVPVVCGAFTPTEAVSAWRAGASLVKVFPAGRMGPPYIKDILAPLPFLRLVPTGGVNLENCAAFLEAGAYTVAVGSSLVDGSIIAAQDWRGLAELARRYVEACGEQTK